MRKYLLIDDDDIISVIHPIIIKRVDPTAEIELMREGTEALEYLRQLKKQGHAAPDIIFLDINMPLMNGFQFLSSLNEEENSFLKNTRVVMLSSTIDPRDIEKAKSFPQISDFITKPLSVEYLNDLLSR
jgi:CheY-like chemotaxis protein